MKKKIEKNSKEGNDTFFKPLPRLSYNITIFFCLVDVILLQSEKVRDEVIFNQSIPQISDIQMFTQSQTDPTVFIACGNRVAGTSCRKITASDPDYTSFSGSPINSAPTLQILYGASSFKVSSTREEHYFIQNSAAKSIGKLSFDSGVFSSQTISLPGLQSRIKGLVRSKVKNQNFIFLRDQDNSGDNERLIKIDILNPNLGSSWNGELLFMDSANIYSLLIAAQSRVPGIPLLFPGTPEQIVLFDYINMGSGAIPLFKNYEDSYSIDSNLAFSNDDRLYFAGGQAGGTRRLYSGRTISGGVLFQNLLGDAINSLQLKVFPFSTYLMISQAVGVGNAYLKVFNYNDGYSMPYIVSTISGSNFQMSDSSNIFEIQKNDEFYTLTVAQGVGDLVQIYNLTLTEAGYCNDNCLDCEAFDSRPGKCISCRDNWSLDNKFCICDTQSKKFVEESQSCEECSGLCSTCQTTTTNCLTCKRGHFVNNGACTCPNDTHVLQGPPGLEECVQCDDSCVTCSGTPSTCTSCDTSKGLSLSGGKCSCLDPDTHFVASTGSCILCDSSKGFKFDGESGCTCSSPNQINFQGECKSCDPYCSSCSTSPSTCTSCSNKFMLNTTTSQCECSPRTHTIQNNVCTLIPPPEYTPLKIETKQFDKASQTIVLTFNNKIYLPNKSFYNISVTDQNNKDENGKISEIYLAINNFSLSANNRTLNIATDLSQFTLDQEILKIYSTRTGYPSHYDEPSIKFTSFPIEIYPISYYSTTIDELIAMVTEPLGDSLQFAGFIAFLSSINGFVAIMKLFQVLDYLPLLNIEVPRNVKIFYEVFKGDVLDLIPNPFEDGREVECDLTNKITDAGLDCLLINNTGSVLLIFSVVFLAKLVLMVSLYILKRIFNPKMSTIKDNIIYFVIYGVNKLNSYISFDQFMGIFISFQIDIFLAVAIFLKAHFYYGVDDWTGLTMTIFYFIIYFLIFCGILTESIIFFKNLKNQKNDSNKLIASPIDSSERFKKAEEQFKRINKQPRNRVRSSLRLMNLGSTTTIKKRMIVNKVRGSKKSIEMLSIDNQEGKLGNKRKEKQVVSFSIFFDDIHKTCKIGQFVILLRFLCDLSIPIFIIFLVNYPLVQVSGILISVSIRALFIVITRPFNSICQNIIEFLNEFLYSLILFLYFLLAQFSEEIKEKNKYNLVGNLILLLVFVILIINTVNMVVYSVMIPIGLVFRISRIITKKSKKNNKINRNKVRQVRREKIEEESDVEKETSIIEEKKTPAFNQIRKKTPKLFEEKIKDKNKSRVYKRVEKNNRERDTLKRLSIGGGAKIRSSFNIPRRKGKLIYTPKSKNSKVSI